ncbi:site-2 protease family protein [Collinsella tanakaei]|uniref:site-2 protease family protein n=1 Tax=Collinsella tanakaei TaxID=626935 RepID=UPI001F2F4A13|nr:site-2 protease family protein [Collinsella tanakaei]MCF2620832.1 site-2 protease family protein [Collinsella tanakaei]
MNWSYIASLLVTVVALIIGIVIHECAHALVAYVLGDRTARSRGRVSLNPIRHIDPFGTVLLPLLMIAAGGPVFAFAKPVPVYLNNLKHPKRDELLVALAGPISNLVLACVGAVLLRVAAQNAAPLADSIGAAAVGQIGVFLMSFMSINLSLAFFNLIPLPPLDGSSILIPFLRGQALRTYYRIQRYAMPILIIVLYLLPSVLHIDLVGIYFNFTLYPLLNALLAFSLGW